MSSELSTAKLFLADELPQLLDQLKPEQQPEWGLMTPQHMVEHLIIIAKLSLGRFDVPIASAKEELEKRKKYLITDGPMQRSIQMPDGNQALKPLKYPNLQQAIDELKATMQKVLERESSGIEELVNHPFGGPMTVSEWILFHRKHIKHHCIQFGLIPDYD